MDTKRMLWTVGLLSVLAALTGCLSLGASNVTDHRLSRGLVVYVEDSSDAGDRGFKHFEHGMGGRGTTVALEHFNWSPKLYELAMYGLPDRTDSGEAASNLARSLRHYALAYPGRPIVVVGHGHGCHVALNGLEELDPRVQVDRLVLLAPGVDPYRDLSPALRRVRDRCLIYCSSLDVLHGGAGPTIWGTHDTVRATATAAMVGFSRPEQASEVEYAKVHQLAWEPWHGLTFNLGTHNLGPTSASFVREYLRPFILDGALPEKLHPVLPEQGVQPVPEGAGPSGELRPE